MAEKILPLVVDGCGPQRTHPANISDGRIVKKGLAEKWRKQPASRSVQLAFGHLAVNNGEILEAFSWLENRST